MCRHPKAIKGELANQFAGRVLLGMALLVSISGLLAQTPTSAASASATGTISGVIQFAGGKPAAKIAVSINVRPVQAGASFTPFNGIVLTAANGSFTLGSVPNGLYAICPKPPDNTWLAPCDWGTEPRVVVSNGQPASIAPIQLQPGVDLYVRVNDPNGTRASAEGKVPGASLLLAVRSPAGRVLHIPITAVDAAGFDHHLPVPAGTDFLLVAFSSTYSLADATGAPISKQNGMAVTVNVPAGQTQQKEVINIK